MPELVEGALGSFEVFFGGKRLFSKLETGRFPDDREILELLGGRSSERR